MDPNANAVGVTPEAAAQAPVTQAPAAEASPAPAETEATTTPEPNGLQLDADTQKYLSNQNITGTASEVIAALVKRNQQIRNEPKTQAVAEVLNQTEPEKTQQPAPTSTHTLSDMDIYTTQMLVEKQYPDVKVDANFYKEMLDAGINPMSGQEINLNRVFKYAEMKQKIASAEKAIAQASQPAAVPSPLNTVDTNTNSPAQVQEMTKTAAENIIVWSAQEKRYGRAPHPQLEEATRFLQTNR